MATLFYNCRILRDHQLVKDDLWVQNGLIIDPNEVQFRAQEAVDCGGRILAPGFIDLKINGAFGVDFSTQGSSTREEIQEELLRVSKGLPAHGVTSFCPTILTSDSETYQKVLPHMVLEAGSLGGVSPSASFGGAQVLGVHLDGPFINPDKKGAHNEEWIQTNFEGGMKKIEEIYGSDLTNVKVVTLAPELPNAATVVKGLCDVGVVVSLGHSDTHLKTAELAVTQGATMISHLFNAMPSFHHRDPSLVGLLASDNIPKGRTVYFGIIADGVHTHPAALKMALKIKPEGLVLITDAIAPMGLAAGQYTFGGQNVTVATNPKRAFITGTETLFGSVANLNSCVRFFRRATGCSVEYALEAASLHPARCLGLEKTKGSLMIGADADFVLLDEELHVISTYIGGYQVYSRNL